MKNKVYILYLIVGVLSHSPNCFSTSLDFSQGNIMDDNLAEAIQHYSPTSITTLADNLKHHTNPQCKKERINLSKNLIFDQGVGILDTILWSQDKLPNLKELDLSFNRISAKALPHFKNLLKRDKFKYLNIVGNPAASIEAQDYFKSLEKSLLTKIIWIPEDWIEARNWIILLKERGDFEGIAVIIAEAHNIYYGNKKVKVPENETVQLLKKVKEDINPYHREGCKHRKALDKLYNRAQEKDAKAAKAANKIGLHYFNGEVLKQDMLKALLWFKHAITLGNTNALYNAGSLLVNGADNVEKDTKQGRKLIKKAAKKGHIRAREFIGWNDTEINQ